MTAAAPSFATADLSAVSQLARQLRVDSIRATTSAGSGHTTSSMSAADILAVLVSRHLRYDWSEPREPANDHLIFSKGHASPLLYWVFKAVGVISDEELVRDYRRFGSRLEGHPTPALPWVDVATGSLGQGLPDAVGIALAGKYLEELPFRVWVLCGDSEMAEGSMWEALDKASYYHLSNLLAIVDVNRLGQRGPTDLSWDLDTYARRVEAFAGAQAFVAATGIDTFAAAVGNLHGRYPVPKQLDLQLLAQIRAAVAVNLSLHGGSGTPGHYFRAAAEIGVSKINLNSDLRYAYRTTLERQLRDHPKEYAIVKLIGPVIRAVQDVVEEHIDLYGSAGRARRS